MQSLETKSSRPRPKSFETETRPETFETETWKIGSRDTSRDRDQVSRLHHCSAALSMYGIGFLIVLNKSDIFGILIQSKIFFEWSSPILIRWTCRNIWSNPVYVRKKFWLNILQQWSVQCGYPYLIRLSLFKIQSNPDPVL